MICSVRREQDSTIVVEVTRAESVRGDAETVSASLVEDGIVSDVKAGENLGRTLHHERIVRELVSVPAQAAAYKGVMLRVPVAKDVNLSRASIVVFVQGPKSGGNEAAAVMKLGQKR